MTLVPPDKIAKRDSWKTAKLPESRRSLDFHARFTLGEFEYIKRGLIPHAMEDKWFIFFESPWLYFHRSWSGECVFAVRFEVDGQQAVAAESWVGVTGKNQRDEDRAYARALLAFLLDAFLLGKKVSFPVPSNLPITAPKGLYQHAVVGRGYPEVIFPLGSPVVPSFWARLRHLLQKRWDPLRFR